LYPEAEAQVLPQDIHTMTRPNLFSLLKFIRSSGFDTGLRSIQYHLAVRRLDRRFKPRPPRGRFMALGKTQTLTRLERGVCVEAEQGQVLIEFLTPEVIRVRMRADGPFPPPFSYAIDPIDWPRTALQAHDNAGAYTIQSEQVVCRIHKEHSRLSFHTPDGRLISEDAGGLQRRETQVRWTRRLPADERCYGLGQRASGLNLRGKRLALWNADPVIFERDDDPVYTSIPFYVGARPGLVVGIFWDNPARGYVDLGAEQPDEMTFCAEDGELRFYVLVGADVPAVLKHYTALTGQLPLPPIWALGFHQSRWSYESEAEFRELAQQFRQRQLPCDVLYFDIDYMDGFRCFSWDRGRFPMLPRLLADLEHQGFKAVAIIDPGIKVDPGYEVYEDGVQQDVFLKYPNGTRVTAPVWPGKCHFPDFTSARVRAWWMDHLAALTQAGFAGIWNDMNEPALIVSQVGETLPDYVVHDWDGLGQTHVQGGHNVYGLLMSRATRDGVQKQRPKQRPFVMTRATYAGGQRYASNWTGDNKASWDQLKLSISMVLQAGLSGLAFTGPDVGGFVGERDTELYARWMQLGSMLPYFRVHSAKGTSRREPWAYGERIEGITRQALELRYQLLPYIYSVFAQCAQDGMPVVRPLFFADPDDEELHPIDDAFLLGDAILVAPVVTPGATRREIYLPRGVWYEYDTGRLIDGARSVTVDAPLEKLPVYIRAGKVIPLWPLMQYVGERPILESRLRAYAGRGETTLYEDAGEGLAYQQGEYRWSYFTCKFLPSGQFAIEWRRAGHFQPAYDQIRVEVVGISAEPEMVSLDGQAAPIWYYEAGIVEFIVKPFGEARIIGRAPSRSQAQRTLTRRPKEPEE
jgi:alpha-glucosidase